MIQRAVTAIIGVVIGLFATFAVFGAILGGLDSFYLLTQDACNYGTENAPKRALRLARVADGNVTPEDVDWSASTVFNLTEDVAGCVIDGTSAFEHDNRSGTSPQNFRDYFLTPNGDYITVSYTLPAGDRVNSRYDSTIPLTTAEIRGVQGRSASVSPNDLNWIEAEEVFTAQRQLVTLLAVIAAIGMPIGAMTAIVFFGQAVISSGVSGQGASQVLVAIAAVVVILVAVQMFQQFAGYLGDAFDAVDGDRFVVFDETLGSLAETIAEFWGVLAFAGLINIATIVWRNYGGSMNIGGQQGGL